MNSKGKTVSIVVVGVLLIALTLTGVFFESPTAYSTNAPTGTSELARVACLGDSITNITGYPEQLQTLLGKESVVGNFGVNGATVNLNSNNPYFYDLTYRDSRNFLPTAVVVMLGTNDARTDNYQKISSFTANYERMLNRTMRWNSTQQVFLVIPPPIFNNTLDLNPTSYANGVVPLIRQVSSDLGLTLIDIYTPLISHPEYFPDGVHPNCSGAQIIANTIYQAITANVTSH
jgi:lysophospholipase L1-like esterase